MKNIKRKKIFRVVKASLLLAGLTLMFSTCDVGLGEAVDTENPSLSVTYPPKNAIVRDKFVLSGSCKDDRGIATVSVKLTNTDTGEVNSFNAGFDSSSWRIELNEADADGKYPYSDGKYVAEIEARDGAGRKSGIASVAFDIDNTAPVMLLSKPTTTGSSTSSSVASYGRKFQLAGDVSEDHNVSSLKLKIYKYAGNAASLGDETKLDSTEIEIPINNFSQMSADNPLVVAQYYTDEEAQRAENLDDDSKRILRNNYLKIYGNDFENADGTLDVTKMEDRFFYCAIELSDNAKIYQNPGDSGSGDGNITDKYYLSTTKFYDELQSESAYGLSAYKLKNILNGTGKDYSDTQIEAIKTTLKKEGYTASSSTVTAEASSVFLVNPNNSPVWNISGYEVGNANNAQLDSDKGDYREYHSGSSLSLNFAAGKDQSYVKPTTIVVKKFHMKPDENGNYVKDPSSEEIIIEENSWTEEDALNGSKSFTLSNSLVEEEIYGFEVSGQDRNNNDIIPQNSEGYGFVVASNTNPPTIIFTKEDEYFSGKDAAAETGIKLVGQITTERKALHATDPITLIEKEGGEDLSFITNESTGQKIATVKASYVTSKPVTAVEGKDGTYDFEVTLKNTSLVPAEAGKYKYKVTLQAKDDHGRTTNKYVYFHIDNKDPEITINSVSPVVQKTVDGGTVKYLNGEVIVKTNISDNYEIKESKYAVKSTASGTPADSDTVIKDDSLGVASSPDIHVDTREIAKNTKIYVQIDSEDKAGTLTNKATKRTDVYVVDQETDRPTLSPSNFSIKNDSDPIKANDNLFGVTNNNRLLGTIEDDDGLKNVVFSYRKNGAGDWTELKKYEDVDSTTLSFDVTLPTDEAKYEIKVFANDKVYGKDAASYSVGNFGTAEYTTFVAVSAGAPSITIDQTEPIYFQKGKSKTISGRVRSVTDVAVKGTNKFDQRDPADTLSTSFEAATSSTGDGAQWTDTTVECPSDATDGKQGLLTYTATNVWGEASTATLKYIADSTAPKFINEGGYKFKISNKEWTSDSWFNNNSLSINGWLEEGYLKDGNTVDTDKKASGIAKVYYIINPVESSEYTEENSFSASLKKDTVYWNFSANIAGFVEGENTLRLKAVDHAGNESVENYLIKVDLTAPGIEGVSTVNFSNGKKDIQLTGTATDPQATSGLSVSGVDGTKLAAKVTLGTENYDITSEGTAYGKIIFANGSWTLDIDCYDEVKKEVKSWLSGKSGKLNVKVSASDNAGNNSGSITVTSITIDAAPPVPVISSPVSSTAGNETIVNKTISIRGSVSEENELASTTIKWKKESDTDDKFGTNGLGVNTFEGTAGYNWSTTFNTVNAGVTDGTKIVLRVTALDSAGNEAHSDCKITVDQNTDRPVIRFTNITLNDGTVVLPDNPTSDDIDNYSKTLMASDNYIWVKNSSELYGNIDDDDNGTVVMRYIIKDDTDPSSPKATDWSDSRKYKEADLDSSKSWNISLNGQGRQRVYFYIKDAEHTEFYAAEDASENVSPVRLSDGKNRFGKLAADKDDKLVPSDTVLYARVDTEAPALAIGDLSVDGVTFTNKTGYDSKVWYNKTLDADKFNLGGTTEYFEVMISASDANGIASLTGYTSGLKDSSTLYVIGSGKLPNQEKLEKDHTVINDTAASIKAFKEDYTPAGDIKDAKHWIAKIPCGGTGYENVSGTMTVTITAVDGAGISSSSSFTVNVDNTPPKVSVKSPLGTKQVSGDVTVYGEVDTPNKIWFAISPDGENKPDGTTKAGKWADSSDVKKDIPVSKQTAPSYTELKDPSILWFLYFDGDEDPSLTTTHSKRLKDYLVKFGIATNDELYGNDETRTERSFFTIVKLYVWVKATDAAGNVTEIAHPIYLDPQGDLPEVSIDYPEAVGSTLGGSVTLRGSASDPNGSVENVFVQMISEKDINARLTGDAATKKTNREKVLKYSVNASGAIDAESKINIFAPTKDDVKLWLSRGYKVYDIKTRAKATQLDGSDKAKLLGTELKNASDVDALSDVSSCMILAQFSGSSWKLTVNSDDSLNPADGEQTNPVAFRVWAEDNDTNLSSYAQTLNPFDADTPIFGEFHVIQSSGEDIDAAYDGSQSYMADMWVKGDWYLVGSVSDKDKISRLTIDGKSFVENKSTGNDGSNKVKITNDGKDVAFKYKLNTGDTGSVGNRSFIITAEDAASTPHPATYRISINYDNKNPVVVEHTDSDFKISSEIKQTNNFYTFSSKVKEEAHNGQNQSGFDYVLFYFVREYNNNGTKTYSLFDPMISQRDSSGNANPGNKVSTTTQGLKSSDGLYWFERKSLNRNADALNTLEWTKTTGDENIHKGGICRIGKAMYLIEDVVHGTKTTVRLNGNPEVKFKDAEFAFANVINNTIAESEKGALQDDGYYAEPFNDDGDRMIEAVTKSGAVWTWEGNICSKNIPDGPITLHYIAFDKAGNYTADKVTGNVTNNAPRLAGVKLGTDDNGNGSIDSKEWVVKYARGAEEQPSAESGTVTDMIVSSDMTLAGTSLIKAKGYTEFVPEIVGGNGNLYYSWSIGANPTLNEDDDGNIVRKSVSEWKAVNTGAGTSTGDMKNAAGTKLYSFASGNPDYYRKSGGTKVLDVISDKPIAFKTGDFLRLGITDADKKWFNFRIWDSTDELKPFETSQFAEMSVAVDVKVQSSTKPWARITPFYWTDNDHNSLYENKKTNGHIELESDWTAKDNGNYITSYNGSETGINDADPKVSGKIVIRGTAHDDKLLSALYVYVPGMDSVFGTNGLKLASKTEKIDNVNRTFYKMAEYNTSTAKWTYTSSDMANGFTFVTKNDVFSKDGHDVDWELAWDTSRVAGVAMLDVDVQILAVNQGVPAIKGTPSQNATTGLYTYEYTYTGKNSDTSKVQTQNGVTATGETKLTSRYRMDVVPYITEVTTELSSLSKNYPTMYSRTAMGHYPVGIVVRNKAGTELTGASRVVNGGKAVTLSGFNLGGNTTVDVSSLTTAEDASTGGKSHKYKVTVSGVDSINNVNNNNAMGSYGTAISDDTEYDDKAKYAYNRQPNNQNNNNLTDDVVFDIWEINSAAAKPISGHIEQPVMKIRPTDDGKIGFAFVNGPLYFSMGGSSSTENYSYQYWSASFDFFTSVGFTYDDAGNSYGVAAGGDINSGEADKFSLYTSGKGVAFISNRQYTSYDTTKAYRMESIAQFNSEGIIEFDKQRIKSPSLAVANHGTTDGSNIYMAYYDAMNEEIRLRVGNTKKNLTTKKDEFLRINYTDQTSSNYKYGHVTLPANHESLDGKKAYLCDYYGNSVDNVLYTITGSSHNAGSTDWWLSLKMPDGTELPTFPIGGPKPGDAEYSETDNDYWTYATDNKGRHNLTAKNVLNLRIIDCCSTKGSVVDSENKRAPKVYEAGNVSFLAGANTGNQAGEYVSIAVKKGASYTTDILHAVWYDSVNRELKYASTTKPLDVKLGDLNYAKEWSSPVTVFDGEMEHAGEYCKIEVDAAGGVHIAAYDPVNLDLVYAYKAKNASSFKTCVVDSNGVVGSNLTLDVALVDGKPVPYIGYYATSCIKPKYARLVAPITDDDIDGSKDDRVTGKWELSIVPTSSVIQMQSNQHNDINIGVWKTSGGVLKASSTGTYNHTTTGTGYAAKSYGDVFGNGTKNAVLGYAIKNTSSSDNIETAQMK